MLVFRVFVGGLIAVNLLKPTTAALIETNYSGYLVDLYCYGLMKAGGTALDGSDVIKAPWVHQLHCLRDPARCFESGFYLAGNIGTKQAPEYTPKFKLDDAGNRLAKALLDSYPIGHARDTVHGHFTVIGRGLHSGDGILTSLTLDECDSTVSDHECDSVCNIASGDCSTPTHTVELIPSPLLWAHVVFMILSWGCLLPLGVFWARYMRQNEKLFRGAPVWFAGHRLMQSIGWFLQLCGFACIIAHKNQGGAGTHFQAPHEIIGLIVVIIGSLQPVNAQLRHLACVGHPENPGPGRKQWEMLHRGLGYTAALLGMCNVIIGIVYANNFGFTATFIAIAATLAGISLGIQLPFAIMMEIRRCCGRGKNSVSSE